MSTSLENALDFGCLRLVSVQLSYRRIISQNSYRPTKLRTLPALAKLRYK